MRAAAVALVGLGALFTRGIGPHRAEAQQPRREQAFERGHRILAQIKRDVDQRYYDSTFRGADLEARYRAYDARLDSTASDPQMARALELVGITMSPEDAYRIYERRR